MANADLNNVTLRRDIPSPLTRVQMDTNFIELKNDIEDLELHRTADDPHPQYFNDSRLQTELEGKDFGSYKWVVVNDDAVIEDEQGFAVDTSGGSVSVTLPFEPAEGARVAFTDYSGTWDTNRLFLLGNGETIVNDTFLICDLEHYTFGIVYLGGKWIFTA